jgi:hypothetical protein
LITLSPKVQAFVAALEQIGGKHDRDLLYFAEGSATACFIDITSTPLRLHDVGSQRSARRVLALANLFRVNVVVEGATIDEILSTPESRAQSASTPSAPLVTRERHAALRAAIDAIPEIQPQTSDRATLAIADAYAELTSTGRCLTLAFTATPTEAHRTTLALILSQLGKCADNAGAWLRVTTTTLPPWLHLTLRAIDLDPERQIAPGPTSYLRRPRF